VIPPTLRTYFYQVAGGRFTAAAKVSHLFQSCKNAAGPGQARSEGEQNRHQLVGFADRAGLVGRSSTRVGHPSQLGLSVTNLFRSAVAPAVGLDQALPGQPVADDARRFNRGPAITGIG
jgi:hypothetical protein